MIQGPVRRLFGMSFLLSSSCPRFLDPPHTNEASFAMGAAGAVAILVRNGGIIPAKNAFAGEVGAFPATALAWRRRSSVSLADRERFSAMSVAFSMEISLCSRTRVAF